jgi:flagellin-like protein
MKTIKKMIGSKKAFSEVLAALILMLIAVAAGVVVYAYAMGWIGSATTNPRQTGHLSFDTTYASVSTSKINLAVRNVGGTNLLIANVYVQGVDLTSNCTISGAAIPSTGYSLAVQQVAYLVINYTGMTTGTYYNVQVACKDGTLISQSVQAQ